MTQSVRWLEQSIIPCFHGLPSLKEDYGNEVTINPTQIIQTSGVSGGATSQVFLVAIDQIKLQFHCDWLRSEQFTSNLYFICTAVQINTGAFVITIKLCHSLHILKCSA